jgi:hypothetical protein
MIKQRFFDVKTRIVLKQRTQGNDSFLICLCTQRARPGASAQAKVGTGCDYGTIFAMGLAGL